MPSVGDVIVGLRADTAEFKAGMADARRELMATEESGHHFGGAMKTAGVAVAGLGLATVGAGVETVHMAADFQREMLLVQTQAGASANDMRQLSAAVLDLAPQVGIGPEELAKGLYHFTSAGMNAKDAMTGLTAAAKLAAIGNASLEDTSQAVIATMSAFPKSFKDTGTAVGELNAIVGTGDMRMEQLALALSTGIAPAAAVAGLTMKDVGAGLATITDNATPADQAATHLRMTFSLLESQSGTAQKALASIGIKANELGTDMHMPNGLLVAVTDLREHLLKAFGPDTLSQLKSYNDVLNTQGPAAAAKFAAKGAEAAEVISKAFGGGKTSATIETLLLEFDKFQGKYAAIDKGAAGFADAWAATKASVSRQWDEIVAGAQADAIRIGSILLPVASHVMEPLNAGLSEASGFISDVASALSSADQPVQNLGSRMERLNSDGIAPARTTAQAFAADLKQFGGFLRDDVLPPAEQFGSWLKDDAIPAGVEFGHWFVDNIGPGLMNVGHTLGDVGKVVKDDLVPPMLTVVRDVAPPLTDAFRFLTDHSTILEVLLGVIAARFVAIKAAGAASEVLQFANGLRAVASAEGVTAQLGALTKVVGKGGVADAFHGAAVELGKFRGLAEDAAPVAGELTTSIGAAAKEAGALEGAFARTSTQMGGLATVGRGAAAEVEGIAGAAASATPLIAGVGAEAEGSAGLLAGLGAAPVLGGIALAGIAITGLATDAGGLRTALKNGLVGEDVTAAMGEAKAQIDQMRSSLVGFAVEAHVSDDGVTALGKAAGAWIQKMSDTNSIDDWTHAIQASSQVMDELQQGTITYTQALFTLADKGMPGAAEAGVDAARKIADGYAQAAQSGQMSWADAEQKMANDPNIQAWRDRNFAAFAEVQDREARMLQAGRDAEYRNAYASLSEQDRVRQAYVNTAAQMGLTGKAADAYVNEQMAAYAKGNPQIATANALLANQAAQLGLSVAAVRDLGPDVVNAMLETRQAVDAATTRVQMLDAAMANVAKHTGSIASIAQGSASQMKTWGEGGMVTEPTMGMVGERGEVEWVIPQHKASPALQRAMTRALSGLPEEAQAGDGFGMPDLASLLRTVESTPGMASLVLSGGGGDAPRGSAAAMPRSINIVVELDGHRIGQAIMPAVVDTIRVRTGARV